jgi:NADPH:quinone reductase-like Zn-dependent oxidoreductase
MIGTNVAGYFFITQRVVTQMRKQKSGHIVGISTVLVDQPLAGATITLPVITKSTMPAFHRALDLLHDYDAVFDTVAGETYRRSFKVLKKGGIIVSMLEQPNSELMNRYGVKALFQFTQVNRERLTKLAQWVDQNNISVNVEKTFLLDDAGKALDYQKDVHPRQSRLNCIKK